MSFAVSGGPIVASGGGGEADPLAARAAPPSTPALPAPRRPHDRSPRTPEFQRSPQTEIAKLKSATAASRRRQLVALLTDRAQVGAVLARTSQWIKKRNATPMALILRCRALAMTP